MVASGGLLSIISLSWLVYYISDYDHIADFPDIILGEIFMNSFMLLVIRSLIMITHIVFLDS